MYALMNDPLKDERAIDNSGFVEFVSVSTGVALKTHDGRWVSQVPNQRGRFENKHMDHPGPYETFGKAGLVLTSWNQPGHGPIYSYVYVDLPNS